MKISMSRFVANLLLAFTASLLFSAACPEVQAQDAVYVPGMKVPDGQILNTVGQINGLNVFTGNTGVVATTPRFVPTTGGAWLYFPAPTSPRGVSFATGEWPNYTAVDAWTPTGLSATYTFLRPGQEGYAWWWGIAPTREAYTTWWTAARASVLKNRAAALKTAKSLGLELEEKDLPEDEAPAKAPEEKKEGDEKPPAPADDEKKTEEKKE